MGTDKIGTPNSPQRHRRERESGGAEELTGFLRVNSVFDACRWDSFWIRIARRRGMNDQLERNKEIVTAFYDLMFN